MRNDDKIKYWFTTEKGVHVPVREGQSKEEALKERFSEPKFEKVGLLDGMGEHDELPEERGVAPKKNFIDLQIFAHNSKNMGENQLKKSIRSLEKQIKIHEEKIKRDPTSKSVKHWKEEIKGFKKEIKRCEYELERRRNEKW